MQSIPNDYRFESLARLASTDDRDLPIRTHWALPLRLILSGAPSLR